MANVFNNVTVLIYLPDGSLKSKYEFSVNLSADYDPQGYSIRIYPGKSHLELIKYPAGFPNPTQHFQISFIHEL